VVTKRQRQRLLARQKWERQQARRATRRVTAKRRGIVAAAVVGVLVVGAGGYGISQLFKGDDQANAAPSPTATAPKATPTPTLAAAPRPTKAGDCTYVPTQGSDQVSVGVPQATAPTEDAVATIKTDHGTIKADLFGAKASCAVNSFRFLAGKNALEKTACTGLAVQPAKATYLECGDMTGSGAGGPGYVFGNENDQESIGPGWLVMADGENRNGSRFAITYGDSSTFDHPVTVFGKVSTGLDVVEKVARAGLAPNSGSKGVGRPATSVIIEDVKVTTK